MKKAALIFVYIMFWAAGISQDTDSVYLTELQRVALISLDSTYNFTRYVEPNGNFYFKQGFIDTTYLNKGFIIRLRENEISEKYKLMYEYLSDKIDSINSYFPIINYNNSINEINDEITYSYILRQLGDSDIINADQNILRISYPCEDLNQSNYYFVFKILFFEDSVKMYVMYGGSNDYKGIQRIYLNSAILKKKDVERIKKQLSKVNLLEEAECSQPGNPWILEYNNNEYKRFVISNYCLRNNNVLNPVARLCYSIIELNRKYFNINCSTNLSGTAPYF